jgi:hypothetical protein
MMIFGFCGIIIGNISNFIFFLGMEFLQEQDSGPKKPLPLMNEGQGFFG